MRPVRGTAARAWVQLRGNRAALAGLLVIAVLIFAAIFAPFLTPYNPYAVSLDARLQPPGNGHLLGTDELGRDILARLLFGARVSLWVGMVTVVLSGLIGVAGGLAAGYLGGYWDAVIMRLVDIFLAFPVIILAIAIVAVRGPGLTNVLIALALVYWTTYARVARAVVLTLREEEYTWAARTLGREPDADHAAASAAECGGAAGGPGITGDGQRDPGRGGAVVPRAGHPAAGGVVGLDAQLWHAVPARRQFPVDDVPAWRSS